MSSQFDDDVVMGQNRALRLSGDDPNAAAARHAEAREQALGVQAATEAGLRCERTEQTLTPSAYQIDGEWVPRERIISADDRAAIDEERALLRDLEAVMQKGRAGKLSYRQAVDEFEVLFARYPDRHQKMRHEKAVLDAMAAVETDDARMALETSDDTLVRRAWEAELARREAKR